MSDEDEIVLWGDSQVPDAKVIVENWLGDNHNIPQVGTELEFLPEHLIELQKCKESIHYFAENYYTITVGGNEKQLIKLWDIQKKALDFFQKNNRVVMNSSRQTSKTTLVVLFVLWNLLFGDGIQKIGMLGNKFDLAKLNLNKVKEAYEYLPLFIKPLVERWNEKFIRFDTGNECKICATSSTSFRGDTLTSLVIDEFAFVNESGQTDLDSKILQSLLPTLDAMAYSKHGDNSFCILVSTPYGMNNQFAKIFHKAKAYAETGDKKFKTKFKHFEMLWSDHPERDQEWFENKIIEMGSEVAFWIEFGGSFTMGDNIKRIIDKEVRNYMMEEQVKEPIFTQDKMLQNDNIEDDPSFKIWEFPEEDHIYIAGVDCAEGVGECASTIEVFDITDMKNIRQVAEYENNTVSIQEFPLVILKVGNAYNTCYMAIENNNCGREVVSTLQRVHSYPKLISYHHSKESYERMKERSEKGIVSHNNSKNMSISNFSHFLNRRKVLTIRSKKLIGQMDGFVKTSMKNNNYKWGKMGGADSYDDLVDASCWALFALHVKLVEDYFILDDPKFDKYAKPVKIERELMSFRADIRKTQKDLTINTPDKTIPIFFGNTGGYVEDDIDDISWLLVD